MTRYVDTSILAAYYCPEPLSEQAEQRLRALDPPVISWLTDVELHSALAKKVRRHELTEPAARRVQELFRAHAQQELYRVIPVVQRDFRQARQWMEKRECPLRTLDALHLAIAHRHALTVLTADHVMARAGEAFDLDAELVQADPSP